ncbi:MAG: phosphoribosylformylglycinamidine synthase I, partial [Dehalococcoidales bacterium]|nr:phosphoribosylformylglycinamidine synthase I [Dehalococcoidales bacterium]
MTKVKTLILRAPGTNCDQETAYAFQQAGAETSLVHVNRLIRREEHLTGYQILVVPGGFTYGDDISAGKVLANELRLKLAEDIRGFVERGGLVLGICNGLQVLIKAGILPEIDSGEPKITLAANDSGRFECRWVYLRVNEESPCIFTQGLSRLYLPVANGEGKVVADDKTLAKLNVVLTYTDEDGKTSPGYPYNPSGSLADIAGICDSSGRIFALMPHPERHLRGTQHPRWTREGLKEHGDGFKIFSNAV